MVNIAFFFCCLDPHLHCTCSLVCLDWTLNHILQSIKYRYNVLRKSCKDHSLTNWTQNKHPYFYLSHNFWKSSRSRVHVGATEGGGGFYYPRIFFYMLNGGVAICLRSLNDWKDEGNNGIHVVTPFPFARQILF